MDVFEDIGDLYIEYKKNNNNPTTELEFFKLAFKESMEEMETLRQQYHTLELQFNNKKSEILHYAEEVVQLEAENKTLTEEIVTLKVQEKAYKENYTILKTKNGIMEEEVKLLNKKLASFEVKVKDMVNVETNLELEPIINSSSSNSMANYLKKDDLEPLIGKIIDPKIKFLEKLVSSKMDKLNIEDNDNLKNNSDEALNDNCTEWWCPKHSKFMDVLNLIVLKEQTVEDRHLIQKAKKRYLYWLGDKNESTPRCPTFDRKKGQIVNYEKPKCWL